VDIKVEENHKRYLERLEQSRKFGYDHLKIRHEILKEVMPLSGVIADVGAGKGHMSLALASAGYEIDSIDISTEEQEYARLNLTYYGVIERVKFHISDAAKLFYKDNTVDYLFCVCVIHHIQDYKKVLDEFFRVVKPKGKIIISDFSPEGLELIAQMHKAEGRTHTSTISSLADLEDYLGKRNAEFKKISHDYQDTLVIAT
jgi:ubiquinone/menaquinone biosynthesis C-methylase UbiE